MSSNNVSVSFSIYSTAGKGFTPDSRPIQVDLTIHQSGILASLGAHLTLEEAEEMIVEIKKAITDAKEELSESEGLYPELSEYSIRGW